MEVISSSIFNSESELTRYWFILLCFASFFLKQGTEKERPCIVVLVSFLLYTCIIYIVVLGTVEACKTLIVFNDPAI